MSTQQRRRRPTIVSSSLTAGYLTGLGALMFGPGHLAEAAVRLALMIQAAPAHAAARRKT